MKKVLLGILAVIVVGIYYYIAIPAINIHAAGFWYFWMVVLAAAIVLVGARKLVKSGGNLQNPDVLQMKQVFKKSWALKLLIVLLGVIAIVFIAGSLLSSTFINASRYQKLLTVEEGVFEEDIREVDFDTIPILDKESASLLGDRKMGSMVDMVSQFEVVNDYTQLNYKGAPVRVTPLAYASPIKWLTNNKQGIPAYILIDMATQNTECVKLEQGIRYSKSEYFNRNIYRHLRFQYPTYIFGDQIFFEIDDEGTPYWVCPVKKFNIGLFGGETVGRVVLCNAITGECVDYAVTDVPQWIDKVYSAELLVRLYNYHGVLVNGYWNSVLGQRDCLQTTNDYNYIAMDDDVWVYTGVTSLMGDQANVGFVLMNQRTMETKYYRVPGAIEDSAMSSAEGQVQNLGYRSTFPLLLNIANEPTYFMALKDGAGLVKKYAMVNVQKYQWVAIGDTIEECKKNYLYLLNTNGIVNENAVYQEKSGVIELIAPIVIDGTTHYYVCLKGSDEIFDVNAGETELLDIIRYQEEDRITLTYESGNGLNVVTEIK